MVCLFHIISSGVCIVIGVFLCTKVGFSLGECPPQIADEKLQVENQRHQATCFEELPGTNCHCCHEKLLPLNIYHVHSNRKLALHLWCISNWTLLGSASVQCAGYSCKDKLSSLLISTIHTSEPKFVEQESVESVESKNDYALKAASLRDALHCGKRPWRAELRARNPQPQSRTWNHQSPNKITKLTSIWSYMIYIYDLCPKVIEKIGKKRNLQF